MKISFGVQERTRRETRVQQSALQRGWLSSHGALAKLTLPSGCQSIRFLGLRMKKFDSELWLLNKRNVPYGKLKSSATFYLERTLYIGG
jgi:hypothetical protein